MSTRALCAWHRVQVRAGARTHAVKGTFKNTRFLMMRASIADVHKLAIAPGIYRV